MLYVPLLDRAVDVNKTNNRESPLHAACHGGHLEVTRLLLERGADVDVWGYRLRAVLHLGSSCGEAEAVYLLLQHKADVNAEIVLTGRHCTTHFHGHIKFAHLLVYGAAINAQTEVARHSVAPCVKAWKARGPVSISTWPRRGYTHAP